MKPLGKHFENLVAHVPAAQSGRVPQRIKTQITPLRNHAAYNTTTAVGMM